MKIRIGSYVECCLFGGTKIEGCVQNIEICKSDSKNGRKVKTCDVSKHNNGVIDIDTGNHWCYFYQINNVLKY